MKILYAASKRKGALIQLDRFLHSIGDDHSIKIAAFFDRNYESIDWNLNALLNFSLPEQLSFESDNIEIYCEQVKKFKPDIIVSDLEFFTSFIGQLLNIPVWQVSPVLLYEGLDKKYNLGVNKNYSFLFDRNENIKKRLYNLIFNSERTLVYSHFCDLESPPTLKDKFEWVRPYHVIGARSKMCKHNIVAVDIYRNKDLLNLISQHKDVILFSKFTTEYYDNIEIKNLTESSDYSCNIKNCSKFITSGLTDFLADGFYNNKFSHIVNDFSEQEFVINSILSNQYKIGKSILDNFLDDMELNIEFEYSNKVNFLHEEMKNR